MRSFVRYGLVLGTVASAFVLSSGCSGKKATEYVTGVSTQVSVPRDLKAIRYQIEINGTLQFCKSYAVYDGHVLLPRSLGTFTPTDTGNALTDPITYTILGISQDFQEANASNPVVTDCAAPQFSADDHVRVLRRSTQPYVKDEILLLPLPMKYSCFDKPCGDNQTCKGGVCVSALTNNSTLVPFEDGSDNGTNGSCFNVGLCMGAAVPAVPTNDPCTFALAETPSATTLVADATDPFRTKCTKIEDCNGGVTPPDPTVARACTNGVCDFLPAGSPPWAGLNVAVTYDGGLTKEILDLDPAEGYTIPDPTKPQQFKLAPGLCSMIQGTDTCPAGATSCGLHRITSVFASGTCAAKSGNQSICIADQLAAMGASGDGSAAAAQNKDCRVQELVPPKAGMVVVIENTVDHTKFFFPSGTDVDESGNFGIPLREPAFAQTDLSVMYSPDVPGSCATAPSLKFPFTPARDAGTGSGPNTVLGVLGATKAAGPASLVAGKSNLQAALKSAYDKLSGLDDSYARRAVLVVGNSDFNNDDCGTGAGTLPADLALKARTAPAVASKPVNTYTLKLVNDFVPADTSNGADLNGQFHQQNQLATAGTPLNKDNNLPYNPAPAGERDKVKSFTDIVNQITTCIYDVDAAAAPGVDAKLIFANPLLGVQDPKTPVGFNAACTSDVGATVDGWGFAPSAPNGKKRIYLCGAPCDEYRTVNANAAAFALQYNQTALPVPVYARASGCDPQ
jgi:hypothetical protein